MQSGEWQNTTVLGGDLIAAVARLKEASGTNILMHGYGPVAKTLMRGGLIDELCLWLHPVLAGIGTAEDMLLSEGLSVRLALVDQHALRSGVVMVSYQAAA